MKFYFAFIGTVGRQALSVAVIALILGFVGGIGGGGCGLGGGPIKERHQQRSAVVDAVEGKAACASDANLLCLRPLLPARPVVAHTGPGRLEALDVGQHSQGLSSRLSGKVRREGERGHAVASPTTVDAFEELRVNVARTAVMRDLGDEVHKTIDLIN
ncbi:hypothetical protein TYRP_014883 [Tyrophagus putrescentiae]|nr:hypothetical protein TYRP_014883 [Tyrophagus putrescentiae]